MSASIGLAGAYAGSTYTAYESFILPTDDTTVVATKAAHDRAEAAVNISRAELSLTEASLAEAESDLAKADIRSPITGIVLDRTAEKGQIVAATLNAPILFTLAEDLSRMDLQVAIDEADIGRADGGDWVKEFRTVMLNAGVAS